jgi:DNA-directed RNA polymerase specialized sigma24 family protein
LYGQGGRLNHDPGNQILHVLIHAVSDKNFEDLGQQLLLVAFTPAIHKIYREICQRFPTLPPDDVAQQVWVAFLESAKSPAMLRQNGQLPVALVMNCRKSALRWAMREARLASIVADSSDRFSEPLANENVEDAILLGEVLRHSQRDGLLSDTEHELLLKLKFEGFEAKELADVSGMPCTNHRRVHRLLQTIVNRLQRGAKHRRAAKANADGCKPPVNLLRPKKNLQRAVNFSGKMPFSNSERQFSPERSHQVTHYETDVACVEA